MGAEYSRARCAGLIREVNEYMRVAAFDRGGQHLENAACDPTEVVEKINGIYERVISNFENEHLALVGALLRSTFAVRGAITGNFNKLFDLAEKREAEAGSRLLVGLSRVQ